MRKINTLAIQKAIEDMCIEAAYNISEEVVRCYSVARKSELSVNGKDILGQIIENAEIAADEQIPACQDTGMTVVFLEIGTDVVLEGIPIYEAVNEGVRRGYEKGYLRKSIVAHPLKRINTGDNTPAVIYYDFVKGVNVKISVMPKGFGSENMSSLGMLKPSDGEQGILDFVVKTVEKAGANSCPPLFIGVGIGGTADKAMVIAKKALLRNPGERNCDPVNAELEEKLIKKINMTGIGPAGLGGTTTTFDVFVETYPTHIAGLPVAVNICCHSLRHKERML